MGKGLSWAFMGVNGITGEMEVESGHRQLLFRQTLHLLVVRVNNPFIRALNRPVCAHLAGSAPP